MDPTTDDITEGDDPFFETFFAVDAHKADATCHYCNIQFNSLYAYNGHLKHHRKQFIWICASCPNKRFALKRELVDHLSKEHNIKIRLFSCTSCGFSFISENSLRSHIKDKHTETNDDKVYKCDECPQSFRKPSDLQNHKKVHANIKDFKCEICDRNFGSASNFKRHMQRHTGEKPYFCTCCGRRFRQTANLKRHKATCRRRFNPISTTENQSSINPPIACRKYHCKECGLQMEYDNELKHHIKRKHCPNDEKSNSDIGKSVNALINDLLVDEKPNTQTNPPETITELQYKSVSTIQENMLTLPTSQLNQSAIIDDQIEYLVVDENGVILPNMFGKVAAYISDNQLGISNQNSLTDQPIIILQNDALNQYTVNDLNATFTSPTLYDTKMSTVCDVKPEIINQQLTDVGEGCSNSTTFAKPSNIIDTTVLPSLITPKEEMFNDDFTSFDDFDNFNIEINDNFGDKVTKKDDLYDFLNSKDFMADESCIDKMLELQPADYSTIFEGDVDLESSTNLAANLNQLFEGNMTQYIPTEDDDDLFVVNLNGNMDANQLTDMLNIDPSLAVTDVVGTKSGKSNNKKKHWFCVKCNKELKRRENYISHLALHESSLRRFKCPICRIKFAYKSTLMKHMRKLHTPRVEIIYSCDECGKEYDFAYKLKHHKERDHLKLRPHKCDYPACNKGFYKKCDLVAHQRSHGRQTHTETATSLDHLEKDLVLGQ